MGNAVAFDTYAAIKCLKAAGFDEVQAEALSDTIKVAQDAHLDKLATKRDIAESKADILKWVAGMFIGQTALIIGSMFALARLLIGGH
ncbi:MAG: DUF1640 domain-containing protein [Magnetococcales bacterium]|nr:DUF1640 domain-containing protein [Magnetococcales bacterium]